MAKWPVQCKAISTIQLLYDIRKLELGGTLSLDIDILKLLQSKYPDYPAKVLKRKYQKVSHLGLAGSSHGGGLTERGMLELEKRGIYRWHSLNSMPQLELSRELHGPLSE